MHCKLRSAVFCTILAIMARQGWSQPLQWNQATGTHGYITSTNWNPNAVPTLGVDVSFGPNLVALNVDVVLASAGLAQADNMTFTDGVVEFIGFGGVQLNNNGTVTIDDVAASSLGDSALVIVNGAGGVAWDSVGDATVGDTGFGALMVNSGGDFTSANLYVGDDAGSVGEVNVDGANSILTADATGAAFGIFIGNAGAGTMNVTDGGRVRTTDTEGAADISLGFAATGEGTLNIIGPNSAVIVEDLFVGESGAGHLMISAGGRMDGSLGTTPDAFVAQAADSTGDVTVNGDGSQWQAARIEIGNLGTATLSVEAGGLVRSNSNDMTLGDAGGSGRVAVFGSGTNASRLETANDLYVGNIGLGQLFIGQDLTGTANGAGELSVGSDLRIGANAANAMDNTVVLDGANVSATVADVVFAGELGKGTLEIRSGATLAAARPRIGSSAGADGTLLVTGAGSQLSATTNFIVATNGTGHATISDSGVLVTNGDSWIGYQGDGDGTLIVDAATVNIGAGNSGNFFIGGRNDVANAGGSGSVTVQNGGLLTSALDTIVGGNGTSSGSLTVTGVGSVADFSDNGPGNTINDITTIGSVGGGEVDVLAGGRLDAEAIWLNSTSGNAQTVDLTVDGAGSTVNIDGAFVVGNQGRGAATISAAGQVNAAFNPDANITNRRVIIGNGAASDGSSLTITGAGSRLDYFDTERISVGLNGGSTSSRAKLEVLDGAVLQAVQRDGSNVVTSQGFVVVGDEANAHGQIDVDGAGSLIEARYLELGQQNGASGIVNITNGGLITLTEFSEVGALGNGTGTINVAGADARFEVAGALSVGASSTGATGTLNLADGGAVTNGDQAFVGRFSTSTGVANIGGAGAPARWDVGNSLYIAGTEDLSISGSQTSGSGTVNILANGLVDVTGTTVIKDRGTVTLNGGELATDAFLFQDFADASRPGSPTFTFNSGVVRLTNSTGNTIDSSLLDNLFGGGPTTLHAGQHLAIDAVAVLSAPLRVNGGTLSVGGISNASFANVDFDAGTLNFTNQNVSVGATGLLGTSFVIDDDESLGVPNNGLTVDTGSDLNVIRGVLQADSAMNNGLLVISNTPNVAFTGVNGLTNNGQLVVIDSTIAGAVANIDGDIEIVGSANFANGIALSASGSLGIDLNGLNNFDSLLIGGNATLGGALDVQVHGFTLASGDQFEILDIEGTANGAFTGLADGALVGNFGGVDLFIDYDGGDGNDVVLFTAGLLADTEPDGDVDGADFLAIQRTNPSLITAWQAEFGMGVGARVASSSVPEPTAGGLVTALGGLLLVASRQRSRADRRAADARK